MAARSPLERGRCAEPDMVPADPGGSLGAELWAVKSKANNASSTPHPNQFRRATYETCG